VRLLVHARRSTPTLALMKRTSVAIAVLGAALVASNAWWAYKSVDRGISATYLDASYTTNTTLMQQALAVLSLTVQHNFKKSDVIAAAQAHSNVPPFEKDGYVWVGDLGLQFDANGQLSKATAAPPKVFR
jgi:hypothetical protein